MKKISFFLMVVTFLASFIFIDIDKVYAHDYMLNVDYDDCIIDENNSDWIDEMWYVLDKESEVYHYNDELSTLKYYFESEGLSINYTWTSDVSELIANEIKNTYANSMKKWNNVYFYSYNIDGNVVKNKIINIVEESENDHNISIYPSPGTFGIVALTDVVSGMEVIETGDIYHKHFNNWSMTVMVDYFYEHDNFTTSYVNALKEYTGAHEVGHVLGLRDVDMLCGTITDSAHHHEILMGYGEPIEARSQNITYKDIAGVAITRGFHTDADHKWLYCGVQTNGLYKLLCSVCNGKIEVNNLNGYNYDLYNSCNGNHLLSSGNMMAVASYGDKDYYKCKYCKYVAPFSSIVSQNYSLEIYSDSLHKYTNTVTGLTYSFFEEHLYNVWQPLNSAKHIRTCECGVLGTATGNHFIRLEDSGKPFAPCVACGYLINRDDIVIVKPEAITQVSLNGSYILPNGIGVLVEEDIEAYLNGTLVFYNKDELPEVA